MPPDDTSEGGGESSTAAGLVRVVVMLSGWWLETAPLHPATPTLCRLGLEDSMTSQSDPT